MAVLLIGMMIFAASLQNCCVNAGNIIIYKQSLLGDSLNELLESVKLLLQRLLDVVDALLATVTDLLSGLNLGGILHKTNDLVDDLLGNVRNALGLGLLPRAFQRMTNNDDEIKEEVENIKQQVREVKNTFVKVQRESKKRGVNREVRNNIMATRRTLNTALSGLDFLLNGVLLGVGVTNI